MHEFMPSLLDSRIFDENGPVYIIDRLVTLIGCRSPQSRHLYEGKSVAALPLSGIKALLIANGQDILNLLFEQSDYLDLMELISYILSKTSNINIDINHNNINNINSVSLNPLSQQQSKYHAVISNTNKQLDALQKLNYSVTQSNTTLQHQVITQCYTIEFFTNVTTQNQSEIASLNIQLNAIKMENESLRTEILLFLERNSALNEAFSSLEKVNFNLKEHNGDLQKKYQKASNLRYTAEKSRDDNVKPIPQELRIQYNKALRKIAILDETHPLVGDSRFKFCLTVLRSLATGILTSQLSL